MRNHHSDYRQASSKPDIPTMVNTLREWGPGDPEGKEKYRQELRAVQADQGVPLTEHYGQYRPWADIQKERFAHSH
jgi:hypothetical protein